MIQKDAISKDFRRQVLGYGLTTAEIVYRCPDRHWFLTGDRMTVADGPSAREPKSGISKMS